MSENLPSKVSEINSAHLAFKKEQFSGLSAEDFTQKVQDHDFSEDIGEDALSKKVSYTIKGSERSPIFEAVTQLADQLELGSTEQKKAFVLLMTARLELMGLDTYKAYSGDTFSMERNANGEPELVMQLHSQKDSLERVEFRVNLSNNLRLQKAAMRKATRENTEAALARMNVEHFKESSRINEKNRRHNENPELVAKAFEQVLASGSIVRVQEALSNETNLSARRELWNREVRPVLSELRETLKAELEQERDVLAYAGLEGPELTTVKDRIQKLETMVAALQKDMEYNGQAALNMVFIEYYRKGYLEGALPGWEEKSLRSKLETPEPQAPEEPEIPEDQDPEEPPTQEGIPSEAQGDDSSRIGLWSKIRRKKQ